MYAQSCPALRDPMDYSLPGFSVHGISQARVPEWGAIAFSNAWKWKVKVKSHSKCPTLCDPMDYSLPDSSVHGIFQARVLEWGAIAFSKCLSSPAHFPESQTQTLNPQLHLLIHVSSNHLIAKSWLIWKDPDSGKDWGREEKETTENDMVGWHHRLNGHEFG